MQLHISIEIAFLQRSQYCTSHWETPHSACFCLLLQCLQWCQSHQVARNQTTRSNLLCKLEPTAKLRLNCWEPFQVLKISKIKMMRAPITIPRLFCPPVSFCTHILSTFSPAACKETKFLYFSHNIEGSIYSSTFRIPPVSNYHVHFLLLHALTNFFFHILSCFVLFKPGTFPLFLFADRWCPQDSRLCNCCSAPLNAAVQS